MMMIVDSGGGGGGADDDDNDDNGAGAADGDDDGDDHDDEGDGVGDGGGVLIPKENDGADDELTHTMVVETNGPQVGVVEQGAGTDVDGRLVQTFVAQSPLEAVHQTPVVRS